MIFGGAGCPGQIGWPGRFCGEDVAIVVSCSQNPSGWRSHKRHLLGLLVLLRNPDTYSDKATEMATRNAEKCRGHPQ